MTGSSIQAVVFDRDGVLTYFDTEAAAAYYHPLLPISIYELAVEWQKWGAKNGFPSSVAEEQHFFLRFWTYIGDQYALPSAHTEKLKTSRYIDYVRPFPDARPALIEAKERGLQTAVLSNFTLASLEESLIAAGLYDLVDLACASTVIGAAKPEPDAYLIVSSTLGVRPEQCLFFDDEEECVTGGSSVGMHAYLVDRRRHLPIGETKSVQDLGAVGSILDAYGVDRSSTAGRRDGL